MPSSFALPTLVRRTAAPMSISLKAHMYLVYGKPIMRLDGTGIPTSSAVRSSGNQACSWFSGLAATLE